MFIREWRGRAKQADAARYPEYFRQEVSRQLREAPGFQGGYLSQREVGDPAAGDHRHQPGAGRTYRHARPDRRGAVAIELFCQAGKVIGNRR